MGPLLDLLDTIRLLLAVGVTVYAFLTYRKLRGGTVGKPYAILTTCGLVGLCAAVADSLGSDIAHDLLGITFYLLLFVGFMFLYKSDELTQSLGRLRILMNALPAFISYINPDQRYSFTNKLYATFFGQEISQLREPHVREVLGDQAYQKTRPHIEAALRGEQQSYEYELPHGKEIHHIKAAYVPDMEEGKVKGIFVLGVDITEQKLAENALRNSKERYRRLFEDSPISLWEEDFSAVKKHIIELQSKGILNFKEYFAKHPDEISKCAAMVKVLDANRATLKLYGAKDVKDFVDGLSTVITEESTKIFGEELTALAEGKTSFTSEISNLTLRGETKHVSVICTVVPGYEDTLAKVLVSTVDLTGQEKLEQELRSAKERLEYVIESSPAVIYLAKPLPDLSDYYSVYHSVNTVSLSGFESEEFLGEKGAGLWASRVHPDDLAAYRAATPEFWIKGHGTYEYRLLHKDGTYRWIREEANVIRDSSGNVRDIIGYWTDVTDRKRMEEELLKENRLAAIGETAAMVGHDLRNPLQAMLTGLYLLQKLTASSRDEDRKEALAMIKDLDEQVLYMNKIVSDLQNYSGAVAPEPTQVDLNELLKGALSTVKFPLNVETALSVEGSRVFLDPMLTKRVIINLVTNAIQAMPDGGKVTITGVRDPTSLSMKVQDTGVGIAREDLERIFAPFFTKKAKGQGLGLAVCKRLVEAQDGTITAASELGHGTTFTVTIPMTKDSEAN